MFLSRFANFAASRIRVLPTWAMAFCLSGIAASALGAPAVNQGSVSLKDKTVTFIIGFDPGGGTDVVGRIIASYLSKYLPGQPTVIARNMPGADGTVSCNYLAQQAAPDGLSILMGASGSADPLYYNKPQAHYDPTKFAFVGGLGRGGTLLIANKRAAKRLHDSAAPSAIMGSPGGVPRTGMQMTVWGIHYLDWNAKWVVGYRGTSDLLIALDRDEIDMTVTGNLNQVKKLEASGKFESIVQSGSFAAGRIYARPEFGATPLINQLVEPKLKDKRDRSAFDYWSSLTALDKWLALPPGTPAEMVDTYRGAFQAVLADTAFVDAVTRAADAFSPMSGDDVWRLVERLSKVQPESIDFLKSIMRSQGLDLN